MKKRRKKNYIRADILLTETQSLSKLIRLNKQYNSVFACLSAAVTIDFTVSKGVCFARNFYRLWCCIEEDYLFK